MALTELLLALCVVAAASVHAQHGDKIIASQSLLYGQTMVSASGVFEMRFFSTDNPNMLYLGIRYKDRPPFVWVANRDTPVNSSGASVHLTSDGNLIIADGSGKASWSTGTSNALNPIVQLRDDGNLVLTDGISQNVLWQSFDHPGNTLLPGMKLGFNFSRNLDLSLTSWKSPYDPSKSVYSYKIDTSGVPEIYLWEGTSHKYRSGPWRGHGFSGHPEMDSKESRDLFKFKFFDDQYEVSYSYEVVSDSMDAVRVVLNETGVMQRCIWSKSSHGWSLFWTVPNDRQCDKYARCGSNAYCVSISSVCQCLDTFKPMSPKDWVIRDFSGGCSRQTQVNCSGGDGFLNLSQVKLPDTQNATRSNKSPEECRAWCSSNCSCTAYSVVQGSGCITWAGPLLDLRILPEGGDGLYYRVAASDLSTSDHPHKKKTVLVIVITLLIGASILVFIGLLICKKYAARSPDLAEVQDFPLFTLQAMKAATNNFSKNNKLGQGCFGEVYKGRLKDGQEIAAKKLSKYSLQGTDEFKNELLLITRLQHRNLVRLLGCCIEGDERILIYEHMVNRSLDTFIFDSRKTSLLNWQNRLDIILGIARGLLYLHQDSRLNIIHRDLKPSNILLDEDMNPKISDFGVARIFEGKQGEHDSATRVVGTIGYMSPEYTKGGIFSVKSDVFSFGVVVLEILSGRRNNTAVSGQPRLSLIEHVWRLWQEGRSLEVLDGSAGGTCPVPEVTRCVHVGLLCVQEDSEDRALMSEVCQMLASAGSVLPQPSPPSLAVASSGSAERDWSSSSINEITITVEAR